MDYATRATAECFNYVESVISRSKCSDASERQKIVTDLVKYLSAKYQMEQVDGELTPRRLVSRLEATEPSKELDGTENGRGAGLSHLTIDTSAGSHAMPPPPLPSSKSLVLKHVSSNKLTAPAAVSRLKRARAGKISDGSSETASNKKPKIDGPMPIAQHALLFDAEKPPNRKIERTHELMQSTLTSNNLTKAPLGTSDIGIINAIAKDQHVSQIGNYNCQTGKDCVPEILANCNRIFGIRGPNLFGDFLYSVCNHRPKVGSTQRPRTRRFKDRADSMDDTLRAYAFVKEFDGGDPLNACLRGIKLAHFGNLYLRLLGQALLPNAPISRALAFGSTVSEKKTLSEYFIWRYNTRHAESSTLLHSAPSLPPRSAPVKITQARFISDVNHAVCHVRLKNQFGNGVFALISPGTQTLCTTKDVKAFEVLAHQLKSNIVYSLAICHSIETLILHPLLIQGWDGADVVVEFRRMCAIDMQAR